MCWLALALALARARNISTRLLLCLQALLPETLSLSRCDCVPCWLTHSLVPWTVAGLLWCGAQVIIWIGTQVSPKLITALFGVGTLDEICVPAVSRGHSALLPCCALPCSALLRPALLCSALFCSASPCFAVLCLALLCCALPCCALPCSALFALLCFACHKRFLSAHWHSRILQHLALAPSLALYHSSAWKSRHLQRAAGGILGLTLALNVSMCIIIIIQGQLVLPVLEDNDLNVRCRAIVDAICNHPHRYSVARPRCARSILVQSALLSKS